jgi:hypothetical protein
LLKLGLTGSGRRMGPSGLIELSRVLGTSCGKLVEFQGVPSGL